MNTMKVLALILCSMEISAQTKPDKELKLNLNDAGTHWIKGTFTSQIWLRYTDNNPGSKVNGFAESQTTDIGLRRVRAQLYGQITDRLFFYSQAGINSDGYNGTRKPGLFFHDVVGEFAIHPRALSVGTGLTGWTGFIRFSSPSIATILAYDAPLYQQTTNDVNDQFLRKFSIYAKGKIAHFDYRIVLTKPMTVDTTIASVKRINTNSDFSYRPPRWQSAAYLMWQFLDEESNMLPYTIGTYLGKKKVLNIGAGFQFQPDAVWHYSDPVSKDTINQNMFHLGIDVFFDHPIGKGHALTVYSAISHTDYGKNYLRNFAPMNPATGGTTLNLGGSAFPMYGTGNQWFAQAGWLLPGNGQHRIQPYADLTVATFDRLAQRIILWDMGCNWLLDSHRAKISLNYQNRPVFSTTDLKVSERKGMAVIQIQIAI